MLSFRLFIMVALALLTLSCAQNEPPLLPALSNGKAVVISGGNKERADLAAIERLDAPETIQPMYVLSDRKRHVICYYVPSGYQTGPGLSCVADPYQSRACVTEFGCER